MIQYFIKFGFLIAFSIPTLAGETRTGRETSAGVGRTSVNNSQIRSDVCPKVLADWVDDDFGDKGILDTQALGISELNIFPSEAERCLSSVNDYRNNIKKIGKKTPLADAEKMSSYLAGRYTQLSPSVASSLNRCNALPNGKDQVIKARYYISATKLEAVNSTVLDEMAYIDSIVPNDQAVKKMECNSIFPFPQVGRKCEAYKKILASGACQQAQSDRLNTLVQKSKSAMEQVQQLQGAYRNCMAGKKGIVDECESIKAATQIITSEVPWIAGKKFQDKAVNAQVNPFWKPEIKDGFIKQGIIDQLAENRKAYQKEYDRNVEETQCLTGGAKFYGSVPCSFEDVRKHISELPDLVEPSSSSTPESRDFDNQMQAEKCLIERGIDRDETKNVVNGAVADAVLTVASLGLAAPALGLRGINGMSSAAKMRMASLVETGVSAINLAPATLQAVDACRKDFAGNVKATPKDDVTKESVCPKSTSNFDVAQNAYTSCMADALLTSAAVFPFVKGLKMATGLKGFSKEDLLKLYKDPKQRAEVEKILAKNGRIIDEGERAAAAESVLGRKVSETEKSCIQAAHEVASSKAYNTATNAANPNVETLGASDLRQKFQKLSECGIIGTEAALLMRAGVTGTDGLRTAAERYTESVRKTYDQSKKLALASDETSRKSRASGMYGPESLWARTATALGKSDEAKTAYEKAYSILADKAGLSNAKSPKEVANIVNRLGDRETSDLSEFVAATNRTDLVEAVEAKRISDISAEAFRGYNLSKTGLEGNSLGKEYALRARVEYMNELLRQARSADPLTKQMGETRLKVFRKLNPDIRVP